MTEVADNHWRFNAECNNEWQLFDEDDETGEYPHAQEAFALCAKCPVIEDCRAAGVGQVQGIWAGEIKGGKR